LKSKPAVRHHLVFHGHIGIELRNGPWNEVTEGETSSG
jgi:hypothetical protein